MHAFFSWPFVLHDIFLTVKALQGIISQIFHTPPLKSYMVCSLRELLRGFTPFQPESPNGLPRKLGSSGSDSGFIEEVH